MVPWCHFSSSLLEYYKNNEMLNIWRSFGRKVSFGDDSFEFDKIPVQ